MVNKTAKDEFLEPIKPLLDRFEVFGSPEYTFPRVFVVRERERVYGADPNYIYDGSMKIWVCEHDFELKFETESDLHQFLISEDNVRGYDFMYDEDDFTEVFYHHTYIVKKVFFTRQSAEEYFFAQPKERQVNLYVDEEPAERYGHEVVAICEMLNQLKKELQQ